MRIVMVPDCQAMSSRLRRGGETLDYGPSLMTFRNHVRTAVGYLGLMICGARVFAGNSWSSYVKTRPGALPRAGYARRAAPPCYGAWGIGWGGRTEAGNGGEQPVDHLSGGVLTRSRLVRLP